MTQSVNTPRNSIGPYANKVLELATTLGAFATMVDSGDNLGEIVECYTDLKEYARELASLTDTLPPVKDIGQKVLTARATAKEEGRDPQEYL